jgi:Zn-dependent protease
MELILEGTGYSTEQLILMVTLFLISAISAIAINKAFHALIARRCGDVYYSVKKKASKNPLRVIHADDILSIFVLLFFGFSAVKHPTPQSSRNKNMLIALSGPAANLITCFISLILYQVFFLIAEATYKIGQNSIFEIILSLLMTFASVNAAITIFNLIPVPPLDGGQFIAQIFPEQARSRYLSIEKYSLFILVFLIVLFSRSGIYLQLIGGFLNGLQAIIIPVFSLFVS